MSNLIESGEACLDGRCVAVTDPSMPGPPGRSGLRMFEEVSILCAGTPYHWRPGTPYIEPPRTVK